MKEIKTIITLIGICLSLVSTSQNVETFIEGHVSFLTVNNIYVKFQNTDEISIGDTLHSLSDGLYVPCLKVSHKSSTSCVCITLDDCKLIKGDKLSFRKQAIKEIIPVIKKPEISPKREDPLVKKVKRSEKKELSINKERMRARISASSNSSKYFDDDWNHRLNYRFSINADHIKNSKFSVVSNMNFRQRILPKGTTSNYPTNTFRIYNLAVIYDVDSSLTITLGRKINNKASSLGALDGLQLEKRFGNNYTGVIIGLRPDIYDYSINTNLLQYGAYLGRSSNTKKVYSRSTLGVLEQRNNAFVDRRYAYFQHSSNFNRKLSLYGSIELDLYKRINGVSSTDTRFTSLYVSTRYKFNRRINLNLSYNSRKRILHYETFKTDIEKILEEDEARQGARLRLNIRPFKTVNTGISYGKRFQNSKQNESTNINGFISWSRIPYIKGRISAHYNINKSSYLQSNVLSFRHARSMFKRRVNANMYYRMVNYSYLNNEIKRATNYYGLSLSFRFTRKLSLSILGEFSERTSGEGYRINTKLIQRFDRKNKRKK